MRRTAARDSDSTTTGGFVIAVTSTIFDNGKRIALDGDEATCGNCNGAFKIFGSATRMSCHGRRVVLNGDPVLCPCGQNKVIAGGDSRIFYEADSGTSRQVAATREARSPTSPTQSAAPSGYDEKLVCTTRKSILVGYPYHIETADGRTYNGRLDPSGELPRIDTGNKPDEYTVYWGDEAIEKQYES